MRDADLSLLRAFATVPDIYLTSNDQRIVQKLVSELLDECEAMKKLKS